MIGEPHSNAGEVLTKLLLRALLASITAVRPRAVTFGAGIMTCTLPSLRMTIGARFRTEVIASRGTLRSVIGVRV